MKMKAFQRFLYEEWDGTHEWGFFQMFQSNQFPREPFTHDADCQKNSNQFFVPFTVAALHESDTFPC